MKEKENVTAKKKLRMKDEEIKIRISTKKKEKLREISNARGESMSYVIERLIDGYIEKYSRNGR